MEKVSAMIISYIPGVSEGSGIMLDPSKDNIEELLESLGKKCKNSNAVGCVWLGSANDPFPCLMLKDAKEIADHLHIWAERKPAEWFDVTIGRKHGLYGIALIPRMDKSVERFSKMYRLRYNKEFPKKRNTLYYLGHYILCLCQIIHSH